MCNATVWSLLCRLPQPPPQPHHGHQTDATLTHTRAAWTPPRQCMGARWEPQENGLFPMGARPSGQQQRCASARFKMASRFWSHHRVWTALVWTALCGWLCF
eukprot:364811-Chlamydomonas_euryale.AAC.3